MHTHMADLACAGSHACVLHPAGSQDRALAAHGWQAVLRSLHLVQRSLTPLQCNRSLACCRESAAGRSSPRQDVAAPHGVVNLSMLVLHAQLDSCQTLHQTNHPAPSAKPRCSISLGSHSNCVHVQQVAPTLKQEIVELLDVLLDLHQAFLPEGDAEHAVEIAQLSRTLIHLSRPRLVQQMAALLTTLLSSYGATLSSTDRALGRLLRNVNSLLVQAQPDWAAQLEQVQQQALERQQQVGSSSRCLGLVNVLLLWEAVLPQLKDVQQQTLANAEVLVVEQIV